MGYLGQEAAPLHQVLVECHAQGMILSPGPAVISLSGAALSGMHLSNQLRLGKGDMTPCHSEFLGTDVPVCSWICNEIFRLKADKQVMGLSKPPSHLLMS